MWEEIIRTKNWNVVNDKLNQLEEKSKGLDLSIQESDKKAEEALEKVGLSTDIAERAKGLADKAVSDAGTALTNINNLSPNVSKALTDSGSALSLAQQNEGKYSNLSQTVDTVKGEVATKVTSAQVEGQISAKGYVTGSVVDTKITTKAGEITQLITDVKEVVGDNTKGLTLKVNQTKDTADSTYSMIMTDAQDGSGKSLLTKINETVETAEISKKTIAELGIPNEYENSGFFNSIEGATPYQSTLEPSSSGMLISAVNMAWQTIGAYMASIMFDNSNPYVLSCDISQFNRVDLSTANAKIRYSDGTWQELGKFTYDGLTKRFYIKFKPNRFAGGQILICAVATGSPASFKLSRVMLAKNSTTMINYTSNAEALLNATRTEVTQLKDSWALKT